MKKLSAAIIIILVLAVAGLVFYIWSSPKVSGGLPLSGGAPSSLSALAKSPLVHWDVNLSGMIKAVSDKDITAGLFDEPKESKNNFVLTVGETPIYSLYILPKETPADQVVMTMTNFKGEAVKLGERRIELSQVEEGDQLLAKIEISKEAGWKATKIRIQPQNLFVE